jgi:hypothetical protein
MRCFRYRPLGCPGNPGGRRSVHPAALPALRRATQLLGLALGSALGRLRESGATAARLFERAEESALLLWIMREAARILTSSIGPSCLLSKLSTSGVSAQPVCQPLSAALDISGRQRAPPCAKPAPRAPFAVLSFRACEPAN